MTSSSSDALTDHDDPIYCSVVVQPAVVRAVLADAWQDVLGIEPSPDSDFFEVGGVSLDAFKIATRVAEQLPEVEDVDVFLVGETFERPRFDDLARALVALASAST